MIRMQINGPAGNEAIGDDNDKAMNNEYIEADASWWKIMMNDNKWI